jgi:hypothetical protein
MAEQRTAEPVGVARCQLSCGCSALPAQLSTVARCQISCLYVCTASVGSALAWMQAAQDVLRLQADAAVCLM